MQAERLRMMKERNAAEKAIADKKQKDKEAMYNMIMNILLVVGAGMIIVPVITLTWHIITNRGF